MSQRYMSISWKEGHEDRQVTVDDFAVVPKKGERISVAVAPSRFVDLVVADVRQWFEYGAQRIDVTAVYNTGERG